MPNLKVSLACSDNVRTRPIIDGKVKPDGIDLDVTVLHPSEMFFRQLHYAEFDVSEMSMSSLLMTTANGDRRWMGIPVFTSRRFFHTGILVGANSGIKTPQNLKGKRVGVPEYQQTAALWTRAALDHVYGVKAADMRWWMERNPEKSHGGATGFQPPKELDFQYIPPEKNIGSMLISGELDAAAHYIPATNLVDRSIDVTNDPRVRLLFDDPPAEGQNYFARTGFYPINHGMVMRREVYERHPWALLNVYNAFLQAKNLVDRQARDLASPYFETGLIPASPRSMNADIFAYGIRANRDILSAIASFSHEQALTPRVVGLDELFAPQTMDL